MHTVFTPQTWDTLPAEGALYGVIGWPVAHSLSPAMQQAAFDACGIAAHYVKVAITPDELPDAIAAMKARPFAGWNCTLPHKIHLRNLVDHRDESAELLGGVNTVLNEGGVLRGFSTDGHGWVRAIRQDFGLDVRDLRILILGAGGAGQALARQAAREGCERLVIANRSEDKASALAAELAPLFDRARVSGISTPVKAVPWDETLLAKEIETIDLVVNGTSLGLKPSDPAVLPAHVLQPHLCVYDTIYSPARTRLLQNAQEVGARTANGLSMLLHQGALSFEIWTGRTAPLEAMEKALRQAAGR